MYRKRLEEIRKEKGLSHKRWSDESGVSVDTIERVIHPENPQKDSPRINTVNELCKPLSIELWELFYTGDKSLVALNEEIANLKAERDALIAENAILNDNVKTLTAKVDSLRDDLVDICKNYMKERSPERN